MKNIITLTESDLYRIVKKVIKENYSEEHLKYTNPKTGDECKIKMAKRKNDGRYSAVLTCDIYNNGNESVIAELPIITRTKEQLIKGICNNIETISYNNQLSNKIHHTIKPCFADPDRLLLYNVLF